jgi:ubiquinone/menaquinone biosynthesis C-methylase UbiE
MPEPVTDLARRLQDTAEAFDSVAPTYDGPQGNNDLIQRMRDIVWRQIDELLPPAPAELIDLGCGTGIDAQHFAELGHHVVATDWSPAMVERAAARGAVVSPGSIEAVHAGSQELATLFPDHAARFHMAYSNFGPLNCIPDLSETAHSLAALMRPGGYALFTVIGRWCPWEMAHYARKRRWKRLKVRFDQQITPVGMNGHTIWTRYHTPKEFAQEWIGTAGEWELVRYEGLSTFVPPPYLTSMHDNHPALFERMAKLDAATCTWPVLRNLGDHFLIVLRRR